MIKEVIGNATLYCGDSNEILDSVDAVDSCVTDPPYGLSFMGKQWDYDVPNKELWRKVANSLKSGGHLLSFFGSRTYHRGVIPIEDAGFEIRDQLMWIYGSGFPKSHNIGKKVKEYEGWGTALKPAHEPIVMARKPFKGSVAENVLEHGTGGINIDGCRVETNPDVDDKRLGGQGEWKTDKTAKNVYEGGYEGKNIASSEQGRFPANVMHDGSEEVLEIFPQSKGWSSQKHNTFNPYGGNALQSSETQRKGFHKGYDDEGTAARYFYCAKASKEDRDEGLEQQEAPTENLQGLDTRGRALVREDGSKTLVERWKPNQTRKNNHPTVKPVELMKYLCRLVTPQGGVVLDPFMGSGSTGVAAMKEGFKFVGIELDRDYFDMACARIEEAQHNIQQELFT